MCNCKIKTINGSSYTMDAILKDNSLTKTITDNKVISSECFQSGHPLSIFRYLNCVAGKRFTDLYKSYVEINNDSDVMALAAMNEQGIDMKNWSVNFMNIAKSLVLSKDEMGKSQCILFC